MARYRRSTIMVVIGLLLSWWYARLQRRAPQYAVVTGKGYRPRLIHLSGGGKFLAISFVAIYVLLSQVVPLLVIIWTSTIQFPQPPTPEAIASMSWINYMQLNGATVWRGIKNTVELMILAPIVTIAVAFSISWIVLRSRMRAGRCSISSPSCHCRYPASSSRWRPCFWRCSCCKR